jgi:hypothetical protein
VLRETTSRGLCGLVGPSRTKYLLLMSLKEVVFITVVPITKLFAVCVCVFIDYCST